MFANAGVNGGCTGGEHESNKSQLQLVFVARERECCGVDTSSRRSSDVSGIATLSRRSRSVSGEGKGVRRRHIGAV
jgi:hypothetical protein